MENEDWKLDTLSDLYNTENFTHPTVVFCNTRNRVDALSTKLEERELAASATVGIPIRWLTSQSTDTLSLHSMAKNTRRIVNLVSRILGQARLGF